MLHSVESKGTKRCFSRTEPLLSKILTECSKRSNMCVYSKLHQDTTKSLPVKVVFQKSHRTEITWSTPNNPAKRWTWGTLGDGTKNISTLPDIPWRDRVSKTEGVFKKENRGGGRQETYDDSAGATSFRGSDWTDCALNSGWSGVSPITALRAASCYRDASLHSTCKGS